MAPIAIGLSVAEGLARTVGRAGAPRVENAGAATGLDFGKILSDVASSASQSIAAAEKTSVAAIHGKASAREVVESLMLAEQKLQVALSVRDKAVAALQEISRMTI